MNRFTVSPVESWAVETSAWRSPGRPNHRGRDMGTPDHAAHPIHGARIFAPWDGTVTVGTEPAGAGQWVWVTADDGTLFKCFHLSAWQVRSGRVKAGDVVGFVGNTGASQGAHYHIEVWVNGRDVDPAPFFQIPPPPEDDMPLSDDDLNKIRALVAEEVTKGADKTNLAVGLALSAHLGDIIGLASAKVPPIRDIVDRIASKLGA